jgi:peptidoglycan/LPS O-acetylase OafA/YrhL
MPKREPFIDLIKVIAIILVIFFHFSYQATMEDSLRIVGFVGVSLFFIVSGFILAKNYEKLQKFSLKWFGKRYLKIITVYYPALILILILFYKQAYSGNLFVNLLSHFAFIDSQFATYAYGIISPAWFLAPMILLYLFFPIINRFMKRYTWLIFPAFLMMVGLRILYGGYISINPIFFLGEFCFGISFANNKNLFPILASLLVIIVEPWMIVPFIIFGLLFILRSQIPSIGIIKIISSYTLVLFLLHEGLMNLIFDKWHIYSLPKYPAIILYLSLVVLLTILSNKLYKKIYSLK